MESGGGEKDVFISIKAYTNKEETYFIGDKVSITTFAALLVHGCQRVVFCFDIIFFWVFYPKTRNSYRG